MTMYCEYSAPPKREEFRPVELSELYRKLDKMKEAAHAPGDVPETAYENLLIDIDGCQWAIEQAQAGADALIAQDEDGYYFAVRGEER